MRRIGFTTKVARRCTKPCGGLALPRRTTKMHEALRRIGFTTKGHEEARSHAAKLVWGVAASYTRARLIHLSAKGR